MSRATWWADIASSKLRSPRSTSSNAEATDSASLGGHPASDYQRKCNTGAIEGTARVYWSEDRLPSIGLRPYIVYGPGRDTGMTAGPTLAMAAAVRGEPYTIAWSSRSTFNYAPDAARAFVDAARAAADGAPVYNIPGETVPMISRSICSSIVRYPTTGIAGSCRRAIS